MSNKEVIEQDLVEKIDFDSMTQKQKNFVQGFVDNYVNGKSHSLKKIALEAGYSESTAHNVDRIMMSDKVTEPIELTKRKMDSIRFKALEALDDREKLEKTDARGLVQVINKMTKTKRLIEDKVTEKVQIVDDV